MYIKPSKIMVYMYIYLPYQLVSETGFLNPINRVVRCVGHLPRPGCGFPGPGGPGGKGSFAPPPPPRATWNLTDVCQTSMGRSAYRQRTAVCLTTHRDPWEERYVYLHAIDGSCTLWIMASQPTPPKVHGFIAGLIKGNQMVHKP